MRNMFLILFGNKICTQYMTTGYQKEKFAIVIPFKILYDSTPTLLCYRVSTSNDGSVLMKNLFRFLFRSKNSNYQLDKRMVSYSKARTVQKI